MALETYEQNCKSVYILFESCFCCSCTLGLRMYFETIESLMILCKDLIHSAGAWWCRTASWLASGTHVRFSQNASNSWWTRWGSPEVRGKAWVCQGHEKQALTSLRYKHLLTSCMKFTIEMCRVWLYQECKLKLAFPAHTKNVGVHAKCVWWKILNTIFYKFIFHIIFFRIRWRVVFVN